MRPPWLAPSPEVLDQRREPQQIIDPEVRPRSPERLDRIRRMGAGPAGGQRPQRPRRILEIQPIPVPVTAALNNVKVLPVPGMERMGDTTPFHRFRGNGCSWNGGLTPS